MTIKNVVVATDFGDASMEALAWALRLAEPLGAKVNVVHVFQEQDQQSALRALRNLGESFAGSSAFGSCTARAGDPTRTVLDFALSARADLLVIGLNGGMGTKSELLGGHAEGLLRSAPCPVVVVRPSELDLLAIAEEKRRS
ncbi:MAG TPA: universal stress protein [Polyangiales bacterium]